MASLLTNDERRVAIRPWMARSLPDLAQGEQYDGALVSVGYEPRSAAIGVALGSRAGHKVAVEFPEQRTESYMRSLKLLSDEGFALSQHWEAKFPAFAAEWLDGLACRPAHARVAVDVSSMNRKRIAAIVEALAHVRPVASLTVDLLYAPAQLTLPPGLPEGVLSIAPVSSYFAGELQADASTVGLVGVGYEPNKAAGALSSLEIPCGTIYIPSDTDAEIHAAVLQANRGLLEGADEHEQVEYDVLDPFDCITRLEGRSHSLLRAGDVPAIIPLGPKIFALSGCIVAAIHHPQVQVWRASFDANEHPLEREPDGSACGVTVHIEPTR